jgi:hypothetical protein
LSIFGEVILSVTVRQKIHMNKHLFLYGYEDRAEGKRLLERLRRRWEDNVKNLSSRSGMGRHGLA